eukprot:11711490-Alexandrium_andersonii.AAC.1
MPVSLGEVSGPLCDHCLAGGFEVRGPLRLAGCPLGCGCSAPRSDVRFVSSVLGAPGIQDCG